MHETFDSSFVTVLMVKERKLLLVRADGTVRFSFLTDRIEPGDSAEETVSFLLKEYLAVECNRVDLVPLTILYASSEYVSNDARRDENRVLMLTAWRGEPTPVHLDDIIAEVQWASMADVEAGISPSVYNDGIISEIKRRNLID